MIRLLVTLLLPLAAFCARYLLLPGVPDALIPHGTDTGSLSIVALGLTPALSGYIVVELVAAAVPRWRKLRTGGPVERLRLRRAALILTIIIAVIQAYFIGQWMQQIPRLMPYAAVNVPSPLIVTSTLVGGTGLVLALAWLIDRWGLTSGFSALLATAAVQIVWALVPLAKKEDVTSFDLVLMGAVFVGYVGATVWILRKPAKVPLPASGLVPLPVAHGFFVVAGWLAAWLRFALPTEGSLPHAALFVGLVALQAFAYGRRFTRPAARFGIAGVDLGASVFYVVFMGLPWFMVLRIPFAIDAFTVATGVAVILDIAAEWRARRKEPTLVDVWPLHEVALLGPARDALEKAGIFVHARAVRHRTLLQLFGPFVPIDLYVPAARAEEAQEILARILLGPDAAEDATACDARGLECASRGERDDAIAHFTRAGELAPRWDVPWFHLGELYKKERNWQEAFRCFDEAADRLKRTQDQDALWDLGIAATALGEWRVARAAWNLYGLSDIAEDSDDPLEMDLGPVGVRVGGELVRCRQIDPARAVVIGTPPPVSGRNAGDILLLDGVEHGAQNVDGEELAIYDELARLKSTTPA